MDVVAIIGLATAFFAATIGLAQNDIKKVFAYSTVSQLGYMFLGLGVRRVFGRHLPPDDARVLQGAAVPGRGQRDPRALAANRICATWAACARRCRSPSGPCCAPAVAIAGVPPFSGFFSKDAILAAAYEHAPWMYWVGVFTAGMTAFYVFRALFLTFFGEYRGHASSARIARRDVGPAGDPGGALAGRWIHQRFPNFWSRCSRRAKRPTNSVLMYISVAAGLVGIASGVPVLRGRSPAWRIRWRSSFQRRSTQLIYNKYFVDEIYDATVVKPLVGGSRTVLWKGVDAGLIDGIVNGVGDARAAMSAACCGCCNRAIFAATRPGCCSARSLLIVAMGLVGRRRDEPP